MTAGVIPSPHLPLVFSSKLINGQVGRLSFCSCASTLANSFSENPVPAGESKTIGTIVTNKQRAEIFTAPFGQRAAADNEFLLSCELDLDPGTAAPAAFVERVESFGDQALEAKFFGDP